MEYLIGAAITMIAYIVTNRIAQKQAAGVDQLASITYTQSYVYEMIRPYLDIVGPLEDDTDRQSVKYLSNVYMKIMIVKDKAYWIKDNIFYVADVIDGQVNKENARAVDTMAMSKVELDEMIFIVEKLREDHNDSRDSGK